MAENSSIEWTDATWNPITGCTVYSAGCKHCYAMRLAGTRLRNHPSRAGLTRMTRTGPVWNGKVLFNEQWLEQPLQWHTPRLIFVCAHSDLFHEDVPTEWIDRVLAIASMCPQHTFQILTKRAQRMQDYFADANAVTRIRYAATMVRLARGLPPQAPLQISNWWLGVSAEDQDAALYRIHRLLETAAGLDWLKPLYWLSAEPLLGEIDLQECIVGHAGKLGWCVSGGESGPGARPSHPDWFRKLRDQCGTLGIAYLHKQNGVWAPGECANGPMTRTERTARLWDGAWIYSTQTPKELSEGHRDDEPDVYELGKKRAGRMIDGVLHDSFPQVQP